MRGVADPSVVWERRKTLFYNLIEANGGDAIRVTQQGEDFRPQKWVTTEDHRPYAYRAVLENEIVFDIDTDSWYECRKQTHTLWSVLSFMKIPYWGSLSAGKGTHTHVFLKSKEQRDRLAGIVTDKVNEMLSDTITVDGAEFKYETDAFDTDPRLLTPPDGGHVVREFAVTKKHKKTLWTEGPGGFRPVPLNRSHAYALAGVAVPRNVPILDLGTKPEETVKLPT